MSLGPYRGAVVVTDDDDAFRETTIDLLGDAHYLVLPARSGVEALSRMRGIVGPVVAIVDLVMPGMNGWDLIRSMRCDADLRRIPIVVLSGKTDEPIEGVSKVLRKPYEPKALLAIVEELCRGHG